MSALESEGGHANPSAAKRGPIPKPTERFAILRRRVRITAGTRFNAARRLALQESLSQWSIALSSLGLIILPLAQALGVPVRASAPTTNAVEALLAISVLVFSLLLTRSNSAVRSDRMHRCGTALNRLGGRIDGLLMEDKTDETYARMLRTFDRIIDQHENHATIDLQLWQLTHWDEFYNHESALRFRTWLVAVTRLVGTFAPYLILAGLITVCVTVLRHPPA